MDPQMLMASRAHWLINLVQSALLLGVMALVAWVALTSVLGFWSSLFVIAVALLGLVAAQDVPRKLLLSAYHAEPLTPQNAPELVAAIAELARRGGLPKPPKLYRIPSPLPNAFAMGRADDSVVCVTDGLLELLNGRELVGVLAHEVGHVVNRDLWIMGLADAMSRIVSVVSYIGQLLLLINLPLLLSEKAVIPWHLIALLIFSPTLMALVQLGLSRTREYDADRAAVELTGDPDGLISALLKLERRVGRFWEDILLPGRRIPEPSLLRTHPPTEDRIARLRELSANPQVKALSVVGYPQPSRSMPLPRPRFRGYGTYW